MMMKRNNTARMVILAGVASLALVACEDESANVAFFNGVASCKSNTLGISSAECEQGLREAQEEHQRSAPRYDNEALCEEDLDVDDCDEVRHADGSVSYMPFFYGYMMGSRSHSSSSTAKKPAGYVARPLYSGKGGNMFTPDGTSFGKSVLSKPGTWAKAPSSAIRSVAAPAAVMSKSTVVARGGFSSASRASFGG